MSKIDLLLDDLLETSNESNSPERVLFLAVILQALLDATKPEYNGEPEQNGIDRRHAKAWFTASFGVTAEDFVEVCDHAGVDPDYTRTFAKQVFTSTEVNFIRKRINTLLTFK